MDETTFAVELYRDAQDPGNPGWGYRLRYYSPRSLPYPSAEESGGVDSDDWIDAARAVQYDHGLGRDADPDNYTTGADGAYRCRGRAL